MSIQHDYTLSAKATMVEYKPRIQKVVWWWYSRFKEPEIKWLYLLPQQQVHLIE